MLTAAVPQISGVVDLVKTALGNSDNSAAASNAAAAAAASSSSLVGSYVGDEIILQIWRKFRNSIGGCKFDGYSFLVHSKFSGFSISKFP
jgi:hypothetical protein